ncbi:MAG: hypothetical protein ABSG54_19950, partial [Terriglobia bacterium]
LLRPRFPLGVWDSPMAQAGGRVAPVAARQLVGPDGCPAGHKSIQCFFNPAAFGYANPGEFGNAGRNIVEGPSLVGVDFALHKDFRITENKQLQFRTEFFNLPNSPSFGNPNQILESSTFTRLRSTVISPRDIQFALKFVF